MILNWGATDNNTMGRRDLSQGFGTLRVGIFDKMPLLKPNHTRNRKMNVMLMMSVNHEKH
jgi:hypothetical protein